MSGKDLTPPRMASDAAVRTIRMEWLLGGVGGVRARPPSDFELRGPEDA